MAAKESIDEKKKKAISVAVQLVDLIDEMIPKRKKTIQEIEEIAAKLKDVKQDVNIAKVVGIATSILGGAAGIAGLVATGGLALPLLVGGCIAALTGTATNVGADLVGNYISEGKLDEAQAVFSVDKCISLEIDEVKTKLDALVDDLGKQLDRKPDDIFAEIMFASVLTSNGSEDILKFATRAAHTAVVFEKIVPAVYSIGNAAKFASALEKVSVKGLTRIFGSVFAAVTGVAMIIWDIVDLVGTSIQLHNGSPVEAAGNLLCFAQQLEEGTENLEEMVQEIRSVATTFEIEMRENFTRQIETFAEEDPHTDDEITAFMQLLHLHALEEWQRMMLTSGINVRWYTTSLMSIFRNMKRRLTTYLEEEEERNRNQRRRIPITVVGHGAIGQDNRLPCSLYYATDSLKSVTIYEPWGCNIDASVVYGIIMNTINTANVIYTGEVFRSNNLEIARPTTWNVLPRQIDTPIPTPTFYPMTRGEGALRDLERIINTIPGRPDGLVIPYIRGIGAIDLPEAPLYLITHAFSLLATVLNIDIDFRFAACLGSAEQALVGQCVENTIYYTVDLSARVVMTNNYNFEERIRAWMRSYDEHFINFPMVVRPRDENESDSN